MPSIAELESALIAADKAGDTQAAQTLVGEIDRLSAFQGEVQVAPPPPAPARQTRRGLREQSSLAERLSYEAGMPVSPESGLSWGERLDLGLSDILTEKQAKLKEYYPDSQMQEIPLPKRGSRFIYQTEPGAGYQMVDEPGFAPKDLVDQPQELVNIPLQGLMAAFGPVGWGAQVLGQAAIPTLIHEGKERLETARGFQKETPEQRAKTLATIFGTETVAGGVPGAIGGLIGKKSGAPGSAARDFESIQALRELEPGLEKANAWQIRPDNLIMGRLAAQAGSTAPTMKAAMEQQQMSFADLIGKMDRELPMTQAGQTLTRTGRTAMTRARNELKRDFRLNREEAGQAIKGVFTEDFATKSRTAIDDAYREAGNLAEGVEFDLTIAKGAAEDVTKPIKASAGVEAIDDDIADLLNDPLTSDSITKFINVKGDLGGAVGRAARLLEVIDPQQTNWEVIKEIRSQVGDAVAKSPADDTRISGAAKHIYGALTEVMENPVGGNKSFVSAWQKANALASKRFKVYEQGRVLKLMGEDSPLAVAETIAQNPQNLTPVIREVVDQYSRETRDTIRKNTQYEILKADSPRGLLKRWEDTEAYKWLLPDKKSRVDFKNTVDAMEDLKQLPIERMIAKGGADIDRGRTLIADMGPGEIDKTIRMYGGKASQGGKAMRLAVMDDMLTNTMTTNKDGIPTLDPKKLATWINNAKKRGHWEKLLTAEDKTRIRGMDAYVRRVFKSMSDTGTSLEQAQAIAALKHPSTFLQGFHALFVNNKILAPMLLSPKATKLFKPRTRVRGPRSRVPSWTFAGNFAAEVGNLAEEHLVDTRGE